MALTSITVAGTAISTVADEARLMRYGSGAKRGKNFIIPYRDGEYSPSDKLFSGSNLLLEVFLTTTPSPEENLSDLLALIQDPNDLVIITGTTPFHGIIRAEVELLREPALTRDTPNVYLFPLRVPKGAWEANSAASNAGDPPALTTDGDRPIHDALLTFAGAGHLEHTDSKSRIRRITLESGVPASTVVDLGNRTVTQGGNNFENLITITGAQPSWWMRFEPNLAQTFTSNVSVTISSRDKWSI